MPEPWFSVDEVVSHLGAAKDSVYRWIEQKSLPAHRVGGLWTFKLPEIDGWILMGGARPDESSSRSDKTRNCLHLGNNRTLG